MLTLKERIDKKRESIKTAKVDLRHAINAANEFARRVGLQEFDIQSQYQDLKTLN